MSRKFRCKAVPSIWLESNGHRLDCGPYLSGAVEAKILLEKVPTQSLAELTPNGIQGIVLSPYFKRVYVDSPELGIPLLGNTDIMMADHKLCADLLSRKVYERHRVGLKLNEGDILITCFGTIIGRLAYCRSDMSECAASTNFMRINPNSDAIKPGYLFSFLSCKFGVPLVTQNQTGSAVVNFQPTHIANLPIPRLGKVEDKSHELIQKAANLRAKATKKVHNASTQYLVAAGIEELSSYEWIKNSGKMGFSTSITKTTLRAVNYIPFNRILAEKIKKNCREWRPLGDIVKPGTLKRGPRFKRIDAEPDFGIELLGQREAFTLRPEGKFISKLYLPDSELLRNPDGGIVIAAHGGLKETDTFCRPQFLVGKLRRYLYSEDFLRVFPNENKIPGGALFAFLRSEICFRLLRGCAIGSIQQEFHPQLINEIPIPIVNRDDNNSINKLIRSAYQDYDEAIDCEDEAFSLVERAITQGAN